MWFFSKKQEDTPIERIGRLETRLNKVEIEILDLGMAQMTMKDKIWKKLKVGYDEKPQREEKNPYNSVLLPEE